jgi:hypothetical protein
MIVNILRRIQNSGINKNQRGQIFVIVLVCVLFVSLVIGGALGLAGSSLKQGSIIENRTKHLYTADAGIESAWQKISTGDNVSLPGSVGSSGPEYTINLGNDLTAKTTISLKEQDLPESKTYFVRSIATSSSGTTTIIETLMMAQWGDYYYFLDNAITTEKNCDIKSKVPVEGYIASGTNSGKEPLWIPSDAPPSPPGYGWRDERPTVWPTSQYLKAYYTDMVNEGTANYIGGNFSPSGTYTLNKTLYVSGDFQMNSGILNLNGYTLFVDGNVYIHQADVNPPGTNKPGCIVATKDVEFWPNQMTGDPNNGVFVFCLGSAGAEFQPGGAFYGWIAAQNGVQLKSGNDPSYHWVDPASLLASNVEFPGLQTAGGPGEPAGHVKIVTWKISY